MLLSLDISTSTVGVALFDNTGRLIELSHISPKADKKVKNGLESLIMKADQVRLFLHQFKEKKVQHIAIEEPLLMSNNVNTVGTLLRFNGMITKICFDLFNVVPEYISSYEARKNAFPELMQKSKSGKVVLFGAYPKEFDKKKVIWMKVAEAEPRLKWEKNRNGEIKKEMYDRSDAFTVGRAYLSLKKAA